jgi:hypothetical protein
MMHARRTGRAYRIALLAASLLVSGCAAQVKSDVSPGLLAADQKGVVVLHTHISGKCDGRGALYLSRFDAAENGWLRAAVIPGPSFVRNEDDPLTEYTLKAGEYGIVEVACDGGMAHVHLVAQRAPNSSLLREVVSRPLAIFTVGAGEVVNIGTLEAVSTGPKSFTHRVTPIAPDLLARFQAAKPELAARMVTRLMTVPPDPGNASFAVTAPAPK